MPSNQNPVFTDNETITGDGTVENPLTSNIGGNGQSFAGAFLSFSSNPVAMDGTEIELLELDVPVPKSGSVQYSIYLSGLAQYANGAAENLLALRIREGDPATGSIIAELDNTVGASASFGTTLIGGDLNNDPDGSTTSRPYFLTAQVTGDDPGSITLADLQAIIVFST